MRQGKNSCVMGLTGVGSTSRYRVPAGDVSDGSLEVRQTLIPRAGLLSPENGSDQRLDMSVQPDG